MRADILPYTIDAFLHALAAWKEDKTELNLVCSTLLVHSFKEYDEKSKTFMEKYTRAFAENIIDQLYWISAFDKDTAEKILEEAGFADLSNKLQEICTKYRELPSQQIIREAARKYSISVFFKWLITYSTILTILESKDPQGREKALDLIDKNDITTLMQPLLDLEFNTSPLDTAIVMTIDKNLKEAPADQYCQTIERLKRDIPDKTIIKFEGDILDNLIRETGHIPPLFKLNILKPSELSENFQEIAEMHPRDILARAYEILVMCGYSVLESSPIKFNA